MATENTSADGKGTGETGKSETTTETKVEAKDAGGTKTEAPDIELKFAEGFKPDEALVGKLKPLFKELGLDSAKAQKLVDAYAGHQGELSKNAEKDAEKQFADLKDGFLKDLKADKELGGKNFDATIALTKKAIAKYGDPELTKLFETTGMGNHPAMVRFVAKVARDMAEDSVGAARGGGAPAADKNEALWELYPSMRPKTA